MVLFNLLVQNFHICYFLLINHNMKIIIGQNFNYQIKHFFITVRPQYALHFYQLICYNQKILIKDSYDGSTKSELTYKSRRLHYCSWCVLYSQTQVVERSRVAMNGGRQLGKAGCSTQLEKVSAITARVVGYIINTALHSNKNL